MNRETLKSPQQGTRASARLLGSDGTEVMASVAHPDGQKVVVVKVKTGDKWFRIALNAGGDIIHKVGPFHKDKDARESMNAALTRHGYSLS